MVQAEVFAEFVEFLVLFGKFCGGLIEGVGHAVQRRQDRFEGFRRKKGAGGVRFVVQGVAGRGPGLGGLLLGGHAQFVGVAGRTAGVCELGVGLLVEFLGAFQGALELFDFCSCFLAGPVAFGTQLDALVLKDGHHALQLDAPFLGCGRTPHGLELLEPGVVQTQERGGGFRTLLGYPGREGAAGLQLLLRSLRLAAQLVPFLAE
ncbi:MULTISPECIES: hypothetical protein [unclassified Streptomyces]|uniref:hypothetical protein n=1 Tax=unclassified Streptomyces TaxID=2593676 RepID=UPI00344B1900